MKLSKVFTIIGLILFCVVVFLPPIIHGYVYPNMGDDSAAHIGMLDAMVKKGINPFGTVYTGYLLVGYPIKWVHQLTGADIDVLFLWSNYAILALSGIVIYWVVSRLMDRKTGWLALIITLFVSQGILFQFYYGVLFNLINMGIIFPLLIYFTVRYLAGRKIRHFVMALLFVILFSSFHTSGMYLPAFIAGGIVLYIIYALIKKNPIQWAMVVVGVASLIVSIACLRIFVPDFLLVTQTYKEAIAKSLVVPFEGFIYSIISIPTLIVVLVLMPLMVRKIDKYCKKSTRYLMYILIIVSAALSAPVIFKLSGDPFRQALDLSTVVAMLTAVLAGVFINNMKNRLAKIGIVALLTVGAIFNLVTWFGYNSAMSKVDEEALLYLDTLGHNSYNSSTTIAPWVYKRYTNAEYTEDERDLLVVRNLPMTPRSTINNYWYTPPANIYEPDESYNLLKVFTDGEITIEIYEKKDYAP